MTHRLIGLVIACSIVQAMLPQASAQEMGKEDQDAPFLFDWPIQQASVLQETRPLTPADPLFSTQPRTDAGSQQARDLIGNRTLGSVFQSRGRRNLLAQRTPAMIGDFFGGSSSSSATLLSPVLVQTFTPVASESNSEFSPPSMGTFTPGFGSETSGTTVPLQPDSTGPGFRTVGSPGDYVLPDGSRIPVVSRVVVGDEESANATFRQDATGELPIFEDPVLTASLQEANQAVFGEGVTQFVNAVLKGGFHVEPLSGRDLILFPDTDADTFSTEDVYTFSRVMRVSIPSPGQAGAGGVGRVKIAESSSPLPRDRMFFNYSYFDNVPLTGAGVNINRFTPGVERTFFNGQSSVEVRFPFASTLSSDIMTDGSTNTSEVEFGNVVFNLKHLLFTNESWAFSTGLGITIPTADDLRVFSGAGNELLNVKNESVHLMPFVGGLYAPTDRFFTQGFLQLDFDTNGNPVQTDITGRGLRHLGTINDTTFLFADIGAGYWLFRRDGASQIRGSAVIAELHYNRSLEATDVLRAGPIELGNFHETVELMNVVVGTTMELQHNNMLTLGYATPISGGRDRQFDGELRVMFVHHFGTTDRQSRAF